MGMVHLKDGQDATVAEVALIRVVLGVSQTSEDLQGLADADPASLGAEHLKSTQSDSCFPSGSLRPPPLTFTMAASREQSGLPGLSIIPAVM